MPRTADREPLPRFIEPMLLRPGLPTTVHAERWSLELKWDGMRAQLPVARGAAGATGTDVERVLTTIQRAATGLPPLLDRRA